VTGVLAQENINIAFMRVFRNSKWQNACMVIETDGVVEDCLLDRIRMENSDIVEVCKL
jgi:L-serine dehydratase